MNTPSRPTPWLTAREAAERLRICPTTLYTEVGAGRLRAARIGGRKALRFLPEWCDEYLIEASTIVELPRMPLQPAKAPARRLTDIRDARKVR